MLFSVTLAVAVFCLKIGHRQVLFSVTLVVAVSV